MAKTIKLLAKNLLNLISLDRHKKNLCRTQIPRLRNIYFYNVGRKNISIALNFFKDVEEIKRKIQLSKASPNSLQNFDTFEETIFEHFIFSILALGLVFWTSFANILKYTNNLHRDSMFSWLLLYHSEYSKDTLLATIS